MNKRAAFQATLWLTLFFTYVGGAVYASIAGQRWLVLILIGVPLMAALWLLFYEAAKFFEMPDPPDQVIVGKRGVRIVGGREQ